MEIYIITGRANRDGYHETYQVLKNMEEKPKSYIGNNRRVNKDQMDKVTQGIFRDSFEYTTSDKSKLEIARQEIKTLVKQHEQQKLDNLLLTVEKINNHQFKSLSELKEF